MLSAAGGALGFGLAALAQIALTRYAASAIPLFAVVQTDRTVLFFAVGLSLIAPVIFGIVPALSTSRSEQVTERSESASRDDTAGCATCWSPARSRCRSSWSSARCCWLRSLGRLQDVDPGFAKEHAITFTMTLPSARYADNAARFRAFSEIERRLREQPGVQAVGATSTLALRGFTWSGDTTIEGRAATDYERDSRHMSIDAELLQRDGHPPAGRAAVRRRRHAREAAGDDRERVAGEALLPRAAERRGRRQADRVRAAAWTTRRGSRSSASSPTKSRTAWIGRRSRPSTPASASACRIR